MAVITQIINVSFVTATILEVTGEAIMRGLAYRRHQEKRAKAKAMKHLSERWNWAPPQGKDKPSKKDVGIHAHTPTICSCPMCGNPRRHFDEIPVSEKRLRESSFLH